MDFIKGQYLESDHFNHLIDRFKKDKKIKILKDEIKNFVDASRIKEKDLENAFSSIVIFWAVKTNNIKVFKNVKGLSLSKDSSKINKSITNDFGELIISAVKKMQDNKRAVREALKSDVLDFFDNSIDDIKAFFYENYGEGKEKKERQEELKKISKQYRNDQVKKTGVSFEDNSSIVYLLSLINSAEKDELNKTIVKKAIAAGYIVLAAAKENPKGRIEKNLHFNKIDIDELKNRIKNSISTEVLEDCVDKYRKFILKLEDYEDIPDEMFEELKWLSKEKEQIIEKRKLKRKQYKIIYDI